MSRITLLALKNAHRSFVPVINILCSYKIMSLEEAHPLWQRFNEGQEVVLDIPDDLASQVKKHLDDLGYSYLQAQ